MNGSGDEDTGLLNTRRPVLKPSPSASVFGSDPDPEVEALLGTRKIADGSLSSSTGVSPSRQTPGGGQLLSPSTPVPVSNLSARSAVGAASCHLQQISELLAVLGATTSPREGVKRLGAFLKENSVFAAGFFKDFFTGSSPIAGSPSEARTVVENLLLSRSAVSSILEEAPEVILNLPAVTWNRWAARASKGTPSFSLWDILSQYPNALKRKLEQDQRSQQMASSPPRITKKRSVPSHQFRSDLSERESLAPIRSDAPSTLHLHALFIASGHTDSDIALYMAGRHYYKNCEKDPVMDLLLASLKPTELVKIVTAIDVSDPRDVVAIEEQIEARRGLVLAILKDPKRWLPGTREAREQSIAELWWRYRSDLEVVAGVKKALQTGWQPSSAERVHANKQIALRICGNNAVLKEKAGLLSDVLNSDFKDLRSFLQPADVVSDQSGWSEAVLLADRGILNSQKKDLMDHMPRQDALLAAQVKEIALKRARRNVVYLFNEKMGEEYRECVGVPDIQFLWSELDQIADPEIQVARVKFLLSSGEQTLGLKRSGSFHYPTRPSETTKQDFNFFQESVSRFDPSKGSQAGSRSVSPAQGSGSSGRASPVDLASVLLSTSSSSNTGRQSPNSTFPNFGAILEDRTLAGWGYALDCLQTRKARENITHFFTSHPEASDIAAGNREVLTAFVAGAKKNVAALGALFPHASNTEKKYVKKVETFARAILGLEPVQSYNLTLPADVLTTAKIFVQGKVATDPHVPQKKRDTWLESFAKLREGVSTMVASVMATINTYFAGGVSADVNKMAPAEKRQKMGWDLLANPGYMKGLYNTDRPGFYAAVANIVAKIKEPDILLLASKELTRSPWLWTIVRASFNDDVALAKKSPYFHMAVYRFSLDFFVDSIVSGSAVSIKALVSESHLRTMLQEDVEFRNKVLEKYPPPSSVIAFPTYLFSSKRFKDAYWDRHAFRDFSAAGIRSDFNSYNPGFNLEAPEVVTAYDGLPLFRKAVRNPQYLVNLLLLSPFFRDRLEKEAKYQTIFFEGISDPTAFVKAIADSSPIPSALQVGALLRTMAVLSKTPNGSVLRGSLFKDFSVLTRMIARNGYGEALVAFLQEAGLPSAILADHKISSPIIHNLHGLNSKLFDAFLKTFHERNPASVVEVFFAMVSGVGPMFQHWHGGPRSSDIQGFLLTHQESLLQFMASDPNCAAVFSKPRKVRGRQIALQDLLLERLGESNEFSDLRHCLEYYRNPRDYVAQHSNNPEVLASLMGMPMPGVFDYIPPSLNWANLKTNIAYLKAIKLSGLKALLNSGKLPEAERVPFLNQLYVHNKKLLEAFVDEQRERFEKSMDDLDSPFFRIRSLSVGPERDGAMQSIQAFLPDLEDLLGLRRETQRVVAPISGKLIRKVSNHASDLFFKKLSQPAFTQLIAPTNDPKNPRSILSSVFLTPETLGSQSWVCSAVAANQPGLLKSVSDMVEVLTLGLKEEGLWSKVQDFAQQLAQLKTDFDAAQGQPEEQARIDRERKTRVSRLNEDTAALQQKLNLIVPWLGTGSGGHAFLNKVDDETLLVIVEMGFCPELIVDQMLSQNSERVFGLIGRLRDPSWLISKILRSRDATVEQIASFFTGTKAREDARDIFNNSRADLAGVAARQGVSEAQLFIDNVDLFATLPTPGEMAAKRLLHLHAINRVEYEGRLQTALRDRSESVTTVLQDPAVARTRYLDGLVGLLNEAPHEVEKLLEDPSFVLELPRRYPAPFEKLFAPARLSQLQNVRAMSRLIEMVFVEPAIFQEPAIKKQNILNNFDLGFRVLLQASAQFVAQHEAFFVNWFAQHLANCEAHFTAADVMKVLGLAGAHQVKAALFSSQALIKQVFAAQGFTLTTDAQVSLAAWLTTQSLDRYEFILQLKEWAGLQNFLLTAIPDVLVSLFSYPEFVGRVLRNPSADADWLELLNRYQDKIAATISANEILGNALVGSQDRGERLSLVLTSNTVIANALPKARSLEAVFLTMVAQNNRADFQRDLSLLRDHVLQLEVETISAEALVFLMGSADDAIQQKLSEVVASKNPVLISCIEEASKDIQAVRADWPMFRNFFAARLDAGVFTPDEAILLLRAASEEGPTGLITEWLAQTVAKSNFYKTRAYEVFQAADQALLINHLNFFKPAILLQVTDLKKTGLTAQDIIKLLQEEAPQDDWLVKNIGPKVVKVLGSVLENVSFQTVANNLDLFVLLIRSTQPITAKGLVKFFAPTGEVRLQALDVEKLFAKVTNEPALAIALLGEPEFSVTMLQKNLGLLLPISEDELFPDAYLLNAIKTNAAYEQALADNEPALNKILKVNNPEFMVALQACSILREKLEQMGREKASQDAAHRAGLHGDAYSRKSSSDESASAVPPSLTTLGLAPHTD